MELDDVVGFDFPIEMRRPILCDGILGLHLHRAVTRSPRRRSHRFFGRNLSRSIIHENVSAFGWATPEARFSRMSHYLLMWRAESTCREQQLQIGSSFHLEDCPAVGKWCILEQAIHEC